MKLIWFAALALSAAGAAEFPEAEITNGEIKAKLYLPDAERGYYRGTRFDWSGAVSSLEYKGHNFFGVWFPRYDPKLHDAITGPVEEFMAVGYDEAKPGETFLKIGVGALRKPVERAYSPFKTYELVDSGKWSVRSGPDWVEFTHEFRDTTGYAYVYRKTVRLANGKPELALEHSLRNTGKKTIDTSVYDHNFYMIDGLPTGPDVVVKFPFEPKARRSLGGWAEIRGRELTFVKELPRGPSVFSEIDGFGSSPADYDIRVENRKARAGVRQTSDRPISRFNFWSIRTTVCPEPYIHLNIEPGKEMTWRINYEFYTF